MSGRQRNREKQDIACDAIHTIWQTMNITTNPTDSPIDSQHDQRLYNKNTIRRAFAKINKLNAPKQIVHSLFSIKIYPKKLSIDSFFR